MELGKKIQKLRMERSYTQEQLAKRLFVSRTAVSKWETGRGTPNIESLKMIAQEFGITLDELLRAEEVIEACENERREAVMHIFSRIDAVLNLSLILALILPLYKSGTDGAFSSVTLFAYEGRFSVIFLLFPFMLVCLGGIQILIRTEPLQKFLRCIGICLNAGAVFMFILTGQPYPAALYFIYILIKIYFSARKFQ